ncbi:Nudix hydrolase domain [Carpediemonas membranifera]|uniref:Nudix hydrolase domain n=1 Tax=Carpediemonas membranifera TaxID=201153 RepID=A0A8J6AYL6_9EUKA|nr:Nudix hydrolase domain [Carpediemonas membranifera]|eukprot:KAG9395600.1 Nudix hydrolase domain [Carpediemonas membranifera]
MIDASVEYKVAQESIDIDACKQFVPFKVWYERIEADPNLVVKEIIFNSVSYFGAKKRIGFVKLTTKTYHKDTNHTVPGIVFLRGDAVCILVVLHCAGKKYALLTSQPRVPVGESEFLEIPAGMTDGSCNVKGKAIDEMEEETGFKITCESIFDMGAEVFPDGMFYPSVGACDEGLAVYLHEREISPEAMAELEGKLTGESIHEHIKLVVRPLEDIITLPDSKSVVAYALYQHLSAQGKIPKLF